MKRFFITMATAFLVISAAFSLSGCGTAKLSNRLSDTKACDKVLITSWWQWFGISTEADERDAAELLADCKAAKAARADRRGAP